MPKLGFKNFGAVAHQFIALLTTVCNHVTMLLCRNKSFQWIEKNVPNEGSIQNNVNVNSNLNQLNSLDSTAVEEHETAQLAHNNASNNSTNEQHLTQVLVVNDTKIDAPTLPANVEPIARIVSNGNEIRSVIMAHCNVTAPIAREEEASCVCAIENIENGNLDNAVKRSKSRVRNYLKKCKDRLTGHCNQSTNLESITESIPITTTTTTLVTTTTTTPLVTTTNATVNTTSDAVTICPPLAAQALGTISEKSVECLAELNLTSLDAADEDECSYDDINFSLTSSITMTGNEFNTENCDNAAQSELHCDTSIKEEQLARTLQMEPSISALIDKHLSHIYPVYFEYTREVLIRQACDVVISCFDGNLQQFEADFLLKYAEIAFKLKEKHTIGECLIWQEGWPLAIPTGELILHLGALNDTQLKPGDIYLCVKKDNFDVPQFHAVWRSAYSKATVQSRCIDYSDPKAYLSVPSLEMLTDELPQLLQNLLVGVERSIGRISLNELQTYNVGDQQLQHQQLMSAVDDTANNNNNNNNFTSSNGVARVNITNSPKCALKRSELITKNKLLSNKYMLRRLTNRQDSMNSTSSGNSCNSNSSISSDELLYSHNINNNNNNSNSNSNNNEANKSNSISPALPLFCLGNSFPHIDSDEENPDDKRNSLECEQTENEIIPPSSITELPEKLLASGIYIPGTRDLHGHPIVTVDAEVVIAAGLNCYEVATVLLYYSTIPERHFEINENGNIQHSTKSAPSTAPNVTNSTNGIPKPTNQQTPQTFTILAAIESSQHICVIDLICQSLKLLSGHFTYCEILAVCLERDLLQLCKNNSVPATTTATTTTNCATSAATPLTAATVNADSQKDQKYQQLPLQQHEQQSQQQHLVKFIGVDEVTTSVAPSQLPFGKLRGFHHHDPQKWREFFLQLEPFQSQCSAAGQRLVAAMSDIRTADLQGLPTRRQLYAQHRALSRAIMDSELHNLRKCGSLTLARLQELAKSINMSQIDSCNKNTTKINCSSNRSKNNNVNKMLSTATSIISNTYSFSNNSHISHNTVNTKMRSSALSGEDSNKSVSTATSVVVASTIAKNSNCYANNNVNNCNLSNDNSNSNSNSNIDVAIRVQKVALLFNEVDRASKRLEQLTEQRRERLRELTRQRALEDEVNEVTSWITSDGNETLQKFANFQLDCETPVKDSEQEFEKFYFISMKHLAKGRDLHEAAEKMEALRDSAMNLKVALDCFADKLEQARERIEGATRLHQLLNQNLRDENVEQELQRLMEHIGVPGLLEKYHIYKQQQEHQQQQNAATLSENISRVKPNSLNLNCSRRRTKTYSLFLTSTPAAQKQANFANHRISSGIGSFEGTPCECWRESRNLGDMDELLDGDDDCEDGEEEQSKIADSGLGGCERCEGNSKLARICSCQSLHEASNFCDKSHNDDLDDDCYERPPKPYFDIHSPVEANAHLQCFASNLELPKMEEHSCLDQKIQKTLLLIIREMIGTERDYVRSLYYVIENYVDELLRDDIPQPLRGQRNVIFGNIEKIFEFHNSHFLSELERYERNPLKVGAAFLEMESKFYLYALYNKNKPKSDTLMSEYGTAFFKSKQFELNDKMDLASYLLKPVQRMGKYALLLQQLVKACSAVEGTALQDIAADVEELQRAEEMVKFQLRHGNDLLAMDSLRDCDVNVKEQGRLLRQNEFLVWQGRGGKKTLRQIFLFEDLVLFSKARRFPDHKNLDIYLYKNSIKTSDIGLTAHVGDSPTKFEIWFRKRKPEDTWTLQCMSEDIKNAWTEEISKLLWKQAKRNREIRLAEMSSMGIGSKPCLDIRPSNNQISDRSITLTQLGKAPKLRHSFASSTSSDNNKARRPNSLISDCSMSSGTSSSSISTGSSSGHERFGSLSKGSVGQHQHALELINETQTLKLTNDAVAMHNSNNNSNNKSNTNTMSSSGTASSSGLSGNLRNCKRSTTLVSQLSMESGILSDISMTPDQEHASTPAWSPTATTPTSTEQFGPVTVIMRRQIIQSKEKQKELKAETINSSVPITINEKTEENTVHCKI